VSSFADIPLEDRGGALLELGLESEQVGDHVVGHAELVPEMWIPGTRTLRTAILSVWADSVLGLLAGLNVQPTITVTLDLELHLRRPIEGLGTVGLRSSLLKLGRQVTLSTVEIHHGDDPAPAAIGTASFMASPNPEHVVPEGGFFAQRRPERRPLLVPFAERVGVRQVGPGTVEIPWQADNLNATGAIQGGLVALAAEDAILAVAPRTVMTSLSVRYLRPFREGAARATARVQGDLAQVDLVVTGTGKPGAAVTARVTAAH
jgi:acyl-coenzyme A thioesterase PaaI-like protein